ITSSGLLKIIAEIAENSYKLEELEILGKNGSKKVKKVLHFQMPGRLIMGIGALNKLPGIIQQSGKNKPLIVTDAGIVKAGIYERIKAVLENENIEVGCFDKVEPDPRIEIVYDCLEVAKAKSYDVLIGLGGGSSLDITKVVSILLTNGGDVSDYLGIDKIPEAGMNTILIPTTAGTGSEATPIAVLSDKKEHLKKGIVSGKLYPNVALIDPELMTSLPANITAYTGIDALTHSIEAYTNKYSQPFVDTFALESIRLVGTNLRKAVSNGKDIEARYNMSLASLYGGMCLGPVNTAGVHALAYPLGGTFDVPHGIANSLLLPYVMKFNLPANPEKYAKIASALGEDITGLSLNEAAQHSVEAVVQLSRDVGITSRMRDLNIPADAIYDMATAAMKVTRLLNNNPREISLDDAKQIYKNAY
ncbi:MAG: iron-containing alcohol dehydrogenase, partial [Sedimentisphaerales bacterium]|nr:iron-containing alcohol dehydrogenase [Sedimentisphaerales bacterium]